MAYGVGQVQQVKILSPQEHLANALKLRADQLEIDQRTQEAAQKLRAESEKAKNEAWLNTTASALKYDDGSPDWSRILVEADKYNPLFGRDLRDHYNKSRAAEIDLNDKELNGKVNRFGMVARLADTVQDEDGYRLFRPMAIAADPELKDLPEQWDDATTPAYLKQISQRGLMSAAYAQSQREAIKAAADGSIKADAFLTRVLKDADEQQDVDNAFGAAQTIYGLNSDQIRAYKELYGAQYGEGYGARVGRMSMSANELADNTRGVQGTRPNVGSFEDYVTRTYGPTPTSAQVLAARKAYGQADDRPTQSAGGGLGSSSPQNAKLIAQSIIAGRQPPELTGLYGNTDDVRAELERQGYDLTRARQDWQATQKQLATLNGAQQTRLRQAVTFTKDSLDIVQGLADKWKGGQFPLLNKGNLLAAKQGVYGKDAQSIAAQMEAQIADIVSELGTVYKGGNSSTDETLKLASKNLQSDWSHKTMTDAINLIRKNLQIRENSINTTTAVANAGNPYAPNLGGGSGENAKDPMGIR